MSCSSRAITRALLRDRDPRGGLSLPLGEASRASPPPRALVPPGWPAPRPPRPAVMLTHAYPATQADDEPDRDEDQVAGRLRHRGCSRPRPRCIRPRRPGRSPPSGRHAGCRAGTRSARPHHAQAADERHQQPLHIRQSPPASARRRRRGKREAPACQKRRHTSIADRRHREPQRHVRCAGQVAADDQLEHAGDPITAISSSNQYSVRGRVGFESPGERTRISARPGLLLQVGAGSSRGRRSNPSSRRCALPRLGLSVGVFTNHEGGSR